MRWQATPQREARAHRVLAQDVLELDGLRRRRDAFGVELGEHGVLVEDVIELALEQGQLVLGQTQTSQMGDVLDVLS